MLADDVTTWLKANRITKIRRLPVGISFEANFAETLGSFRNPLAMVDKGFVELAASHDAIGVKYEVVCQKIVMLMTALIVLGLGAPLAMMTRLELVDIAALVLLVWVWIVVGSFLIWRSHVRDEIRNIAEIRAMVGPESDQSARNLT